MDNDFVELWNKNKGTLFTGQKKIQENACLNFLGAEEEWRIRAHGYKKGADILVEYVQQTHREQDTLVYPIIFSYRQYLELFMKYLIVRFYSNPINFKFETHDIKKLWKELEKYLIKSNIFDQRDITRDVLDAIREVISEISAIDKSSASFRYPKSKKDENLLNGINLIGLGDFKIILDEIETLFEYFSIYLEQKTEMEAELMGD